MGRTTKVFISIFLSMVLLGCHSRQTETTIASTSAVTHMAFSATKANPTKTITPNAETISTIRNLAFPFWVSDPSSSVFLFPYGQSMQSEGLALINAENGERFDFPKVGDIAGYFWLPNGRGLGILTSGGSQVIVFDLQGNLMGEFKPSNDQLFYFEEVFEGIRFSYKPLIVNTSDVNSPNLMLLPVPLEFSASGNYFVFTEDYDFEYTSVFDVMKKEIVNVTSADDHLFDSTTAWGPMNSVLAIRTTSAEPDSGEIVGPDDVVIVVYDVQSKKKLAEYDHVTSPNWSPDGRFFLYQPWPADVENSTDSFICTLELSTRTSKCYKVLQNANYRITSIHWSPDETSFSFIYTYSMDGIHGAFCTVRLDTQIPKCILEDLNASGETIDDYEWSPNGNFISFFYDASEPFSDYRRDPKLAIANVNTGKYVYLSRQFDSLFNYELFGLWRPPIIQ